MNFIEPTNKSNMYSPHEIAKGKIIAKLTATIITVIITIIASVMYLIPQYRVYKAGMKGRESVSISVAYQQNTINEAIALAKADSIRAIGYMTAARIMQDTTYTDVLTGLIYNMPHYQDTSVLHNYIIRSPDYKPNL